MKYAAQSGDVLVAFSNRKFSVFSVWMWEAMRSIVPSSLSFLRTVASGSRFCCGDALHFAIHFVVRDADRFALRHFTQNQRSFHFPQAASRCASLIFSQSRLNEFGSTPCCASDCSRCCTRFSICRLDKYFRHREIVRIHQLVDQLVLRLALRFGFALRENGFPQRFLQLVHGAEIAQILREIVVDFRQFLAPQPFHNHVEPDGLAGQLLLAVILRIGDVEFLFIARRSAAQILA